MGSLSLLQGIFPTQGSNPGLPHCGRILSQLSHRGSPGILEWVAYPFSRGSSRSWDLNQGLLHCRRILYQLSYQGSREGRNSLVLLALPTSWEPLAPEPPSLPLPAQGCLKTHGPPRISTGAGAQTSMSDSSRWLERNRQGAQTGKK